MLTLFFFTCSNFVPPNLFLPPPPPSIELLHSQNFVHIGLGQKKALHVVSEDVLWQQRRHWRVPQQKNQGHIQTLQEEAVSEECRL